ncbi:MAG TPA: GYD domain-containing protein [Acidimicrobiales bacterium]
MPKYLIIANYSADGAKGVLAKGGSARKEAVAAGLAEMGGSLEAFYFAFGADDAFVVADLPDNVAAAALGLQVGASGMASVRTVVLLTPEEVDAAAQVPGAYRAPGS